MRIKKMPNKFTLVIYNNSLKRNQSVTTHKTYESALKRAQFFINDGITGCSFAINKSYLLAEQIGILKNSSQYRSNCFA